MNKLDSIEIIDEGRKEEIHDTFTGDRNDKRRKRKNYDKAFKSIKDWNMKVPPECRIDLEYSEKMLFMLCEADVTMNYTKDGKIFINNLERNEKINKVQVEI